MSFKYSDIAQNITASLPVGNVSVVVSGDTEYYAKYCKLILISSATTSCEVIVTGTAHKPIESICTVQNRSIGKMQSLKNSLITSQIRAEAVGNWLKTNLGNKKNVSLDWRIDPRMDTRDILNISRIAAGNETRVLSSKMSFSGAFKGKIEGVVIQ